MRDREAGNSNRGIEESLHRRPDDARHVEFRVLGPFEVLVGGVPAGLGGPRQRALLARLVAAAGSVVSIDALIDDLYHGAPPANALASIHVHVSNIRRVIEPDRAPRTPPRLLVARRPGYVLTPDDVDALRFCDLVDSAEQRPPVEALALLEEALGLWRGLPYGEFAAELWAMSEVNRLHELRLTAVERRAQAQLDLGRPQAVIHELEPETGEHPLRERLWWLLAVAHYRSGRQADALATLRRARNVLADQLGLDPGPELQALEQDILQQSPSLAFPPGPGAPPPPSSSGPPPGVPERAGLIGRDRQVATLMTLPVLMERNGVVTAAVSGEPGIGKTRLLQAFRDACAELGYVVLDGRCHEGEGVPPLWPWLQVLRALAELVPPPDRRALAGLLDDERPAGTTSATVRHRNQLIARWLVEAARLRPLVIVLDDLHWADSATLELLRDVTVLSGAQAKDVSLTLVTAFREAPQRDLGDPAGAFRLSADEILYQLARYDLVRVRLGGLSTDEVRELAEEMGAKVSGAEARRLAERTGGNPFFVCESARLLAEGQSLEIVPERVADLIRQRLVALGPEAGAVLGAAALIGRSFDPGLVVEVCGAWAPDPKYAHRALDLAVRAGLLVAGDGCLTFVHDLVRDTLAGDVPPLRRALLHREVMAALSARPCADVTTIAHHAVQAGPAAYQEAARWARAAAGQASEAAAYEEAAEWWGRAVTAHGACGGDPVEHVELLLRQVRALLEAGDAMGARQVRAQALRVAARAGAGPELTARALTALDAPAIWTLRNPYEPVEVRLVDQFDAVLRRLPDDDSPERALLLGGLAQELYGDGDIRCLTLSAEAVAMARRIGDPLLLMRALNARSLSVPQSAHLGELMRVAEELHELAPRADEPRFELLAHMMDTHYKLETHDLAGADRAAARCEAMLEHLQLPWPTFQHTMWRANRLTLDGRFDEAAALYDEAEHQAQRLGMWYAGAVVANGRLMLYYQRGAMAEAGPLIDQITGIHPSVDHDARVLELCARGRVAEARALTRDGWPSPPRDWSWLTMTCLQGAAQAAVGDLPACRATREKLLPYAGRISGGSAVSCIGPVDHFLALLTTALDGR
ncbi:AAA family ATPase [Actinomadura sp. ATCC 31491]|uniref:AAA family ATPase n=1 Tax=Actinomadura luzonensis TaxID=2805427 RepID=A0ABT0FNH9_9ACTN|nr:BTAD domain-containing putative transcriptional regulator [Actinomadura luzonensis]MCK2213723.1 AAA family ATPase [Actinomadura luzonensis]